MYSVPRSSRVPANVSTYNQPSTATYWRNVISENHLTVIQKNKNDQNIIIKSNFGEREMETIFNIL